MNLPVMQRYRLTSRNEVKRNGLEPLQYRETRMSLVVAPRRSTA